MTYYPQPRRSSITPSSSFAQLPRTASFGNLSSFSGGGLSRSRSATVFPLSSRTYLPSSYYTPNYQRYSVVGSTPRIADKYPYVRYSTVPYNTQRYAYTPNTSLLDYSLSSGANRRDRSYGNYGSYRTSSSPSGGFLDTRLSSPLRVSPYYSSSASSSYERPRTPARSYVKYMDLDDAVDLYKGRFLTSGALSKYWLSSSKRSY